MRKLEHTILYALVLRGTQALNNNYWKNESKGVRVKF